MCESSCASTLRTCSQGRPVNSPSVAATAACAGSRPLANAFGCSPGITNGRGIGISACAASSRTLSYTSRASFGQWPGASDAQRDPVRVEVTDHVHAYRERCGQPQKPTSGQRTKATSSAVRPATSTRVRSRVDSCVVVVVIGQPFSSQRIGNRQQHPRACFAVHGAGMHLRRRLTETNRTPGWAPGRVDPGGAGATRQGERGCWDRAWP